MSSLATKLRIAVVGAVSTSVVALGAMAPPAAAQPAPAVSTTQVASSAITVMPTAAKKNYRSTERGLTSKTKRVHRALRAKFPQIKTVLGRRSASSGEHGKGRALDVMLPNWKSSKGKALGRQIANWARSKSGSMKVWYVIYNQRIWNVQRKNEGWRKMRNAGNATGNHRNHVHISIKK